MAWHILRLGMPYGRMVWNFCHTCNGRNTGRQHVLVVDLTCSLVSHSSAWPGSCIDWQDLWTALWLTKRRAKILLNFDMRIWNGHTKGHTKLWTCTVSTSISTCLYYHRFMFLLCWCVCTSLTSRNCQYFWTLSPRSVAAVSDRKLMKPGWSALWWNVGTNVRKRWGQMGWEGWRW